MVWVLKFFLLSVACFLVYAVRYMILDFNSFKKMDDFQDMNLIGKLRIRLILMASILATSSTIGLLAYFMISKIIIV